MGFGAGLGNIGGTSGGAVHSAPPPPAPSVGTGLTHVSVPGVPAGSVHPTVGAAIQRFAPPVQAAGNYPHTVVNTFKAQPKPQQQAIIRGALMNNTLEGKIILHAVAPNLRSVWDVKPLPAGFTSSLKGLSPVGAWQKLGSLAQQYGYFGREQAIVNRFGKGAYVHWSDLMSKDATNVQDRQFIHSLQHQGAQIGSGLAFAGQQTQLPASEARAAIAQGTPIQQFRRVDATANALPKDQANTGGGGLSFGTILNVAAAVNPELTGALTLAKSLASGSVQAAGVPLGIAQATVQHPGQVASNAGKDLWNLAPGTVEGLYGVGKDLVQGHGGNAFSALLDPYVRAYLHPGETFAKNPVNTALMAAGPVAGVGRLAGGAARAGTFGERAAQFASRERAPAQIGTVAGAPSGIQVARDYSPNILTQALQKGREAVVASRGRDPNIIQPKPAWLPKPIAYSAHVGSEAALHRIADTMTSTIGQQLGRADRAQVLHDVMGQKPPKGAADLVTFALQGALRTPETAIGDAASLIRSLKAAQTGKRTAGEIWNRKQVRDLEKGLQDPTRFDHAFAAADKLRPVLNKQDAYLAAKGLLDPEQALRAKLFPYAQQHMGATYDFKNDRLAHPDHPNGLPTQEVLSHLEKNGVPEPAFVAHRPGKTSPFNFYKAYQLARGSLGAEGRTGEAFRTGAYDHTYAGLAGQVASRAQAVTRASLHDAVTSRMGITMPQEMRADLIRQTFARARTGEIPVNVARRQAAEIRAGDFTPAEAKAFARASAHDDFGNRIPNALELTPVSRSPVHTLQAVRDLKLQHPSAIENIADPELQALSHSIQDAAQRTDQTRNVVLVPSEATRRFGEQYSRTNGLLRNVGRFTQQFRRTVLPYSTHWMTQIGTEAGLRAFIAGALDPRYAVSGNRLVHRLENSPEGRAAAMEMVNGTLYNASGRSTLDSLRGRGERGQMDVFNANPNPLVAGAKAFPPTKVLISAHNRYADTINSAMYGLEHQARVMMLGKLAHQEVAKFSGSWQNAVRMQGHVMDQLATNLKNDPALVAKFGQQIDDALGKYSKFTPTQRAMIQSFTPFLPWYLNAAKYVFWHLPVKHPVASSLMASLRQTVNQDIQDGKKLPLNAYALQELARVTPFGIFSPPTTSPSTGAFLGGQHLLDAILPQLTGSLYNLAGVNTFGEGALKGPPEAGAAASALASANNRASPGESKALWNADFNTAFNRALKSSSTGDVKPHTGPAVAASVENLLESFLPLARAVRLAEEGGKPSYGTSTLLSPQPKPGQGSPGAGSVVNRILNPWYSVQRAQQSGPPFATSAQQKQVALQESKAKKAQRKAQQKSKPSTGGGYLLPSGGSSGSSSTGGSGGYLLGGSAGGGQSGSGASSSSGGYLLPSS